VQLHRANKVSGVSRLLILAAICSLTLSLATRFSVSLQTHAHTAKSFESQSSEPKRQNLDRQAAGFARPFIESEFFEPIIVFSKVIDPVVLSSSHIFSPGLYNRPPPALI
jgi:hypothetical protein